MFSKLFPIHLILLLVSCIAPDTDAGTEPIRDSYPIDEIWVVNNLAESLSICNGSRWNSSRSPWIAQNSLLTGSAPNRLYFYNGYGYTVNSYGNSLTIFNPDIVEEIATLSLGNGHNPWAAAFCSRGGQDYALITCFLSDLLLIVNLKTKAVIKKLSITPPGVAAGYRPRPEGIIILRDRAYFTCTGWDFETSSFREGYLGILDICSTDPSNWSLLSYIQTATNPQSLLAVPARGGEVHILSTGINSSDDGLIQIYHTASGRMTTNLPCGGSPHRFATAANGITFLAGGNALLAYNRFTLLLTHSSSNPFYSGKGDAYLAAAAVDTNNSRLYLADFGNDRILQLDPTSGALLKESPSGDGPLDLVYRKQY